MLRFDSIRGYQFVCSFLLFYSNPSLNSIGRMTLKKFSLRPSVVTRGVFFTHPKFHKKKKTPKIGPYKPLAGWPWLRGHYVVARKYTLCWYVNGKFKNYYTYSCVRWKRSNLSTNRMPCNFLCWIIVLHSTPNTLSRD